MTKPVAHITLSDLAPTVKSLDTPDLNPAGVVSLVHQRRSLQEASRFQCGFNLIQADEPRLAAVIAAPVAAKLAPQSPCRG